jgi:hypothetical protein
MYDDEVSDQESWNSLFKRLLLLDLELLSKLVFSQLNQAAT